MTSTPLFADAWQRYVDAGWSGVLVLPPERKEYPPTGYTGAEGQWPSRQRLERWAAETPDGNIAMRMPRDVIGIDIDAYKDDTVRARLEAVTGPLPPTWCTTSRVDGSGIRLYRVPVPPPGTVWVNSPVPGVEIIQHHHRYAVVAPSLHPEGRRYRWVDESSGEVDDDPPEIDDLTELPWQAVRALTVQREAERRRDATSFEITTGPMSATVERRLRQALANAAGEQGSRHDAACRDVLALLRYAERGEPGVEMALELLRDAFVSYVGPDRAPGHAAREFDDILKGGTRRVASTEGRIPTKAERDAEASGEWFKVLRPEGGVQDATTGATTAAGEPERTDPTIELDDLLHTPEEPYDWLIPGLIERGDRVILTGLEGRGKSTLLRQFAIKAASGIHPFDDSSIDPLKVLYVDCENSRRQVRRKIGELRAAAGDAYERTLRFLFRPDGIDLTKTQDVAWLATVIAEHRPDLVVIGPIYKMSNGDPKDERDAKAVATVLDELRVTYAHALLIEAHTPYADGAKSKRPERPYGASLWSRWPEFGIFLGPEGDILHWRGQRDERAWPTKLQRGGDPWPWGVATSAEPDQPEWNGPTHCIRDIVELLESAAGTEFSQNQLVAALRARGASYKDKTIRFAAESAAIQGLVDHRTGARNARLYRAKNNETPSDSPLSADLGPPRPTAAHRGPAAVDGESNDRGRPRPGGTTYPGPAAVVDPSGLEDEDSDLGPRAEVDPLADFEGLI